MLHGNFPGFCGNSLISPPQLSIMQLDSTRLDGQSSLKNDTFFDDSSWLFFLSLFLCLGCNSIVLGQLITLQLFS